MALVELFRPPTDPGVYAHETSIGAAISAHQAPALIRTFPYLSATDLMSASGKAPRRPQIEAFESSYRQRLLCWHRQCGKALHIDTPIFTDRGWVSMGDISPYDCVYDEQGMPCNVTAVSPIRMRPVYTVKFSDGSEIVADAEHLWTTLDANARYAISHYHDGEIPKDWYAWKSKGRPSAASYGPPSCEFGDCPYRVIAKGLCGGHYQQRKAGKTLTPIKHGQAKASTLTTSEMLQTIGRSYRKADRNHAIPSTLALRGKPVILPIHPYVLGAWLGDGHSTGGRITNANKDVQIIAEIENSGYRAIRERHSRGKSVGVWRIAGLTKILRDCDLYNNKHIPRVYFDAPESDRLALLQGLFDTDGTVSNKVSRCEFTTTSPQLAEDVYELMMGLGLIVSKKQSVATLYGREISNKWRLFCTPHCQIFRLKRKADGIDFNGPRQTLRRLRYVTKIEPAGHALVKCITVDSPSRLFLAGKSLIPTHNSTACAAMAWETAYNEPGSLVLLLSRTQRQATELLRKVREFYFSSDVKLELVRSNEMSLETEHHSRILSLPANADTVLGYSDPDLIVLDEAARVPDSLYHAIRPMLAVSQGRIIALSTPWGKRGWFYEAWKDEQEEQHALDLANVQALLDDLGIKVAEEDMAREPALDAFDWHRIMVTAVESANDWLSKRYLANERRTVPDLIFRSEWLCEFTDPEGSVFRYDDVMAMLSDSIVPLWQEAPEGGVWVTSDVEPLFD